MRRRTQPPGSLSPRWRHPSMMPARTYIYLVAILVCYAQSDGHFEEWKQE